MPGCWGQDLALDPQLPSNGAIVAPTAPKTKGLELPGRPSDRPGPPATGQTLTLPLSSGRKHGVWMGTQQPAACFHYVQQRCTGYSQNGIHFSTAERFSPARNLPRNDLQLYRLEMQHEKNTV